MGGSTCLLRPSCTCYRMSFGLSDIGIFHRHEPVVSVQGDGAHHFRTCLEPIKFLELERSALCRSRKGRGFSATGREY